MCADTIVAEGFFTTGLVCGGRLVWQEAHLERLAAHAVHFGVPFDGKWVKTELGTRFKSKNELFRCRISYRFATNEWKIETESFSPAPLPLKCRVVEIERPLGPWKTFPRRDFRLLPGEEAILVGCDGRVYEGSYSNLFLVRGNTVLTPPADGTILPGICRALFIRLLSARGYTVRKEPFEVGELHKGTILLTNALCGVMPAVLAGE